MAKQPEDESNTESRVVAVPVTRLPGRPDVDPSDDDSPASIEQDDLSAGSRSDNGGIADTIRGLLRRDKIR